MHTHTHTHARTAHLAQCSHAVIAATQPFIKWSTLSFEQIWKKEKQTYFILNLKWFYTCIMSSWNMLSYTQREIHWIIRHYIISSMLIYSENNFTLNCLKICVIFLYVYKQKFTQFQDTCTVQCIKSPTIKSLFTFAIFLWWFSWAKSRL